MGGRAAVDLGWKHPQRAGMKKAGKDPESIFLGEPHDFGHAYRQESSQAGHSGPVLLSQRISSVSRKITLGGLVSLQRHLAKHNGFRELHLSP